MQLHCYIAPMHASAASGVQSYLESCYILLALAPLATVVSVSSHDHTLPSNEHMRLAQIQS